MDLRVDKGKIRAIMVGDKEIRLKKPVKIENYEELEERFQFVKDRFVLSDFAKIADESSGDNTERANWDRESLYKFIRDVERRGSPRQVFFLKTLADHPEQLYIGELVDAMKDAGYDAVERTMGGIQGSLTKRAENSYKADDGRKRERIWISRRDQDGEKYYVLQKQYREPLKEYFAEED